MSLPVHPSLPLLTGLAAIGLLTSATQGAVLRTESGSPPLHWNFDTYLSEYFPDQNPSTRAIRFHLGTTVSRNGVQSNEWNAVRAAFAQWQAIPGTKIRFEEAAPVSNPSNVSALDGRNDVVWLGQGTYGQTDLGERISIGSGTIALTVLSLDYDFNNSTTGTIVEADAILNKDLDFFTDYDNPTSSRLFLESAMLHEIGHWLGMNHSPLGAASLWWYSAPGVSAGDGLSSDEISFARSTYGRPETLAADGTLRGTVRIGGSPVLGALVSAERPDGILVAGTATEADGSFRIPGLPPGQYRLRAYPADPNSGADVSLVRGVDLDVSASRRFANANTSFLPTLDSIVQVTGGSSLERNLSVSAGSPPFRITEIRSRFDPSGRSSADQPLLLPAGQSNLWVGVFTPANLPTNATLSITGPGLSFGPTQVLPRALRQLTLVQIPVTVASNAPPGLRSIELTADGFTARAVGFVDVAPLEPDHNFDSFDDRFQRRFFAPWTRSEATPEADPDADGFVNRRERTMGSDPTDRNSTAYRITRIRMTVSGTTLTWDSASGRRYQVWGRETLGAAWTKLGNPISAAGESAEFTDARPTSSVRLYRVGDSP